MMVIDLTETNQGGGSKTQEVLIDLSTLVATRETYGRIIEAYAEGTASENKAKSLAYLLNGFIAYWRLEKDIQIEERLNKIEELIQEAKK